MEFDSFYREDIKYIWRDIIDTISEVDGPLTEDKKVDVLGKLLSTVVFITEGDGYFIKVNDRDQGVFDVSKKLSPNISFEVVEIGDRGKPRYIKKTLSKFIEESPIKKYSKTIFRPFGPLFRQPKYQKQPMYFNTFSGWKAKLVSDIDTPEAKTVIDLFSNHLRVVWANEDPVVYKWLRWWFRTLLFKPEVRTKKMPIIVSKQGSGKTSVTQIVIDFVMGRSYGDQVEDIATINSDFNKKLQGKSLFVINELQNKNRGGAKQDNFISIKSKITDSVLHIEPKHKEPYTVDNYLNLIAYTNDPNCISIEDSDRRLVPIVANNVYVGNFDYHSRFQEVLYNQFAGNVILSWFGKMDDVEVEPEVPVSELKKDLVDQNMGVSKRYLKELMLEEEKLVCPKTGCSDAWEINTLFSGFKKYCEYTLEKPTTQAKFAESIKNFSINVPDEDEPEKMKVISVQKRKGTKKLERNQTIYYLERK